jgi:hypothetical protein
MSVKKLAAGTIIVIQKYSIKHANRITYRFYCINGEKRFLDHDIL